MCLPRMRTAEGVLQQLQADDPGTQMTLCSIRKIIRPRRTVRKEEACRL